MRVLVVEDDAGLREMWHDALEASGHVAVSASAAEDARKRLMTQRFDAVMLDLCLGEDSGLSVAAMATYANPDCRVVMVTGSNLFVRGELFAMTPNIATVLRKPVRLCDLLAVLEYEAGGRSGMSRAETESGDAREEVDAAASVNG